MKPLISILFSLLLSTSAFCQSAVDSFFNIKMQKPPENWVELIQQKAGWKFYEWADFNGDSLYMPFWDHRLDPAYETLYFTSDKVIRRDSGSVTHWLICTGGDFTPLDSFDRYSNWRDTTAATYFPSHNTIFWKTATGEYHIDKVLAVSSDFLAIETISIAHYDEKTGDIVTVEIKKHGVRWVLAVPDDDTQIRFYRKLNE